MSGTFNTNVFPEISWQKCTYPDPRTLFRRVSTRKEDGPFKSLQAVLVLTRMSKHLECVFYLSYTEKVDVYPTDPYKEVYMKGYSFNIPLEEENSK